MLIIALALSTAAHADCFPPTGFGGLVNTYQLLGRG